MPVTDLTPFRSVNFPKIDLKLEMRDDGTVLIRTTEILDIDFVLAAKEFNQTVLNSPNKTAIAERTSDGQWLKKTFFELKAEVDATAQWLLDRGANASTPIMIISGNSIAHAIIRTAALAVGAPFSPVSENYALLGAGGGFSRLKYAAELISPSFVFAETAAYADAANIFDEETVIISKEPEALGRPAENFNDIVSTKVSLDLTAISDGIDPDATAAILLTSGSTGKPKAVVHTNRMICAWKNLLMWTMKDSGAWDDLILVWLPWSHVSGLHTGIASLLNGTSLYLDSGKPIPGLFDQTIENIRELSLYQFLNVPSGYQMLADAMEADFSLRDAFFKEMRVLTFAGASMPQPLFDKIQKLAVESTGQRIVIVSGYGMTETTSGFMSTYYESEKVGAIGLPHPGAELKLVPFGDRYELRVKGATIFPGYLNRPDLTAPSFDEEGYYRTGDACTFVNQGNPHDGIYFAGRMSEEFKLNNGSWVATSTIREEILKALSPSVFEVLICGENQDYLGLLAWPNPMLGAPSIDDISERINAYNRENSTLSRKIKRLALLDTFPDLEGGEMTDKGTVNQRLSLKLRAENVQDLYAVRPSNGVLCFD
mgnify:CR=1 FL=1